MSDQKTGIMFLSHKQYWLKQFLKEHSYLFAPALQYDHNMLMKLYMKIEELHPSERISLYSNI